MLSPESLWLNLHYAWLHHLLCVSLLVNFGDFSFNTDVDICCLWKCFISRDSECCFLHMKGQKFTVLFKEGFLRAIH